MKYCSGRLGDERKTTIHGEVFHCFPPVTVGSNNVNLEEKIKGTSQTNSPASCTLARAHALLHSLFSKFKIEGDSFEGERSCKIELAKNRKKYIKSVSNNWMKYKERLSSTQTSCRN